MECFSEKLFQKDIVPSVFCSHCFQALSIFLVLFYFPSAKRNKTISDRKFWGGPLQEKTIMTNYILEEALSSPALNSCFHYKRLLNELEIPPSRDAPLTSKTDILPMHLMLTTCIKVEIVNTAVYAASFVGIKMSLNIISPDWHSHNDKNVNIKVGLVSTVVIIKWLLFQLLSESWEI